MTERSEGTPGAPAPASRTTMGSGGAAPERELTDGSVLPDGAYEALVVDATELADDALAVGVTVIDVTLLEGTYKGALVTVRATGLGVDALDLLAAPCLLVVAGGNPRVTLDGL